METSQRVVQRSVLFSRLLLVMVILSVMFLGYSLVRENLPARLTSTWPWKLRLLDIQSAVAAVLASGGAALARAQYARTVRPVLGHFGRVNADMAPGGQLAWVCHLFNGGQEVAVVTDLSYWIVYTPEAHARGVRDSSRWVLQQSAVAEIETCSLSHKRDFSMNLVGPGRPIPGQQLVFLGWFTEKAMRELENVFVRVHAADRVGDTHERVIDLMKGVQRVPVHPDPPAPY
ncbi:hypothetical protein OG209_28650 [Streptomyces sp. NBC_01383]|uniref:hypothetical protein n=1 Tax=Streptomyces sp. NBC_01383 TaxID=2903846 RepID=UPI0032569315